MKKFIVVLLTISLLAFSCALPVFSVDEPKWYDLTVEETLALVTTSEYQMIITYNDSTTFTYKGRGFTPQIVSISGYDYVFMRLPNTNQISGKSISNIDLIFPLSLKISSCTQIYAPSVIVNLVKPSYQFDNGPGFGRYEFHVDNDDAPDGSKVIFNGNFSYSGRQSISQFGYTRISLSDYDLVYPRIDSTNNYIGAVMPESNRNYISSMTGRNSTFSYRITSTTFLTSDVTTIGYDIYMGSILNSPDFVGLGIVLSPISFYASSYTSNPDDPDNPSDGSGDYTEQLDKIYDELVKQGQVQQSQNDALLQGQQDIKDSIDSGFSDIKDTLVTTSPEQESQISENSSIITSQSEVISSMAQEIDDFNSSVGGGGHKAEAHSGAGHIASATDDIDFDNPSSIWSIIGSFFEGHGGLLITVAVFTWLFVLFKIILYGVHS